jgi:asparagine synthase (glutamine-hydrolysing)
LLKRAVRGIIPDPIITRKKQGFDVPLARWLPQNAGFVRDVLMSPVALGRGYFDRVFVEALVTQALSGQAASPEIGGQIWNLLCLELWHLLFIDQDKSWLGVKNPDEYLDRQQVFLSR